MENALTAIIFDGEDIITQKEAINNKDAVLSYKQLDVSIIEGVIERTTAVLADSNIRNLDNYIRSSLYWEGKKKMSSIKSQSKRK